MSHHELDARRLLCPMPVIRVQERVGELAPGEVLAVRCTDPGVVNDVPAWCRVNGHRVLDIAHDEDNNEILITIEVGRDG